MASLRTRSKPSPARKASLAPAALPPVDAATRRAFRRDLSAWYREHRRDLPWRRTRDPYAVTVSEFMLQQTQVGTVLPYYGQWMRRFPDWAALARAREKEVIKAWEGLGYYRRARTLHRLAQTVLTLPGRELPGEVAALESLPGIGPYTARAVGSIAFGLPAAVVDGNVMRVLARVFNRREDIAKPATQKWMQQLADALAPAGDCGDYNQAVMELGALVCTPRAPRCLVCPVKQVCRASDPETLPVKTRARSVAREETVAVIERRQLGRRQWWLERPPAGERLELLWRFPHWDGATMTARNEERPLAQFTYSITKYRVRLCARPGEWRHKAPSANGRAGWFEAREVEALALASAHRKVWACIDSA